MTLNDDIDRLSQIALFEGFSIEQLRLLAFGAKRLHLRAGEEVYHEGASTDGGYLVISGQIDLMVTRDGREIVLSSQLEKSLIGELALITSSKTVAGAVARSDSELLHIPRELFKRMLLEYPELAQVLHNRISQSVTGMLAEMTRVQAKLSEDKSFGASIASAQQGDKRTN